MMNLLTLQQVFEWTALIALAVCSLTAIRFSWKWRTRPPTVLGLASGAIVASALIIEIFPSYDLRPDGATGNIVAVEQYHALHAMLYTISILSAVAFAVAFGMILRDYRPRRESPPQNDLRET